MHSEKEVLKMAVQNILNFLNIYIFIFIYHVKNPQHSICPYLKYLLQEEYESICKSSYRETAA